MTIRETLTFGAIWALGISAAGLSIGVHMERRRAEVAKSEALVWKGKANAAATELAQAKQEIQEARHVAQEAAQAVQALRARLDALPAIPPRPAEPPSDPQTLVGGLRALGLRSPELIEPHKDQPLVWTWGQTALRVPALEGRLDASTSLIEGLDEQVTTLQRETLAYATALAAAERQAEAQRGRAETLDRALKATPAARPWSVGALWAAPTLRRPATWGGLVRRDLGPAFVEVIAFPDRVAVGAGWRF